MARPAVRELRVAALAGNRQRLFLTSATILFVELMLIRWVPSNVIFVGFFSNFLLMASFLGIGVGILLGRRIERAPILPFGLLLLVVVALVYRFQLNVQVQSQDELFFGLAESTSADINFLALPLVILLVTALLASLALPLGPLLRSMPPLTAYGIDILGSLAGIVAFTVLAAAGTDPIVWFGVAAILGVLLELGSGFRPWSLPAVASLVAVMVLVTSYVAPASQYDSYSPYYRVTAYQGDDGLTRINVNGVPHQQVHPIGGGTMEPFYEQVYKWFPGRTNPEVLVVGAGSGSDVALALARGASHVDAVEIDPRIVRLGIEHHPDRPYDDARVRSIVNDGRAFLRGTTKRYDLIVFALPDSLTLVSSTANLRLESFLFTEEAFASVRDHLTEDGIFVLYNYYREPWLVAKLATMLEETFGHPPLIRTYRDVMAALAAGPRVAALQGGPPPGDTTDPVPEAGEPIPRSATDDWPFLYLRTEFIAPYYLAALGLVLLFALVAVAGAARFSGTGMRRFSPHFFVLGTAFLLLETRSLVSFSLLFGTTWLVNALAFFAILASVLLAILINARFRLRRPWLLYVALFVALAAAFLVPPESLLVDPPWLRYVLASALAFAPIFCANLVFSYSFRDTRTADTAFASNLLGAMVGGALEYLALLTGYRALILLVAVLYGLAYVFATRVRLLADQELESEPPPDWAGAATSPPARAEPG